MNLDPFVFAVEAVTGRSVVAPFPDPGNGLTSAIENVRVEGNEGPVGLDSQQQGRVWFLMTGAQNKPLTPKQQADYLETPNVCPYCENDTFHVSDVRQVEGNAFAFDRLIQCQQCERKWLDVYTLTAIEPVE